MWAKCVKCNCSESHFGEKLHLGCHITGVFYIHGNTKDVNEIW